MICEHRYVPFPGSRSKVYCEYCGVGRDAFAKTERAPRPAPTRARRPSESGQTETPPSLFDPRDPDLEAARDAVNEMRARRDLESRVRELVDGAGLSEDEADDIVREALDFGPALDLDAFASQLEALGDRQPTLVPHGDA